MAAHPLILSPDPHGVHAVQAVAVFDACADGREAALFADLYEGSIGRWWRVEAVDGVEEAPMESAEVVAFDPFLSQTPKRARLRRVCTA